MEKFVNKENTQKLRKDFPELLHKFALDYQDTLTEKVRDKHKRIIRCDDGWYKIIHHALEQIQLIVKTAKINISVSCIKKKFGTLSIHIDYNIDVNRRKKDFDLWFDICQTITTQANFFSSLTCEKCSDITSLNKDKNAVLCEKCQN